MHILLLLIRTGSKNKCLVMRKADVGIACLYINSSDIGRKCTLCQIGIALGVLLRLAHHTRQACLGHPLNSSATSASVVTSVMDKNRHCWLPTVFPPLCILCGRHLAFCFTEIQSFIQLHLRVQMKYKLRESSLRQLVLPNTERQTAITSLIIIWTQQDQGLTISKIQVWNWTPSFQTCCLSVFDFRCPPCKVWVTSQSHPEEQG